MHLNTLILLAIAAVWGANAQEVPAAACESSCGNVPITFPFGSREGCYYSSDFLVTCDRSSGEPVPFFGPNTSDVFISSMSTSKSEVEIMMFVAQDCYNTSGPADYTGTSLWMRDFRISTKNIYVGIGCDTLASFSRWEDESDGSGCISRCGRNSPVTNGSCSGVGCCQVAVPEGLQSVNMTLSSFNNHSKILDFNPCSYAFFVEQGKFNFSATNLLDFASVPRMPMLLDWAIGNLTCDKAKDMENFLCKGNSVCDQNYTGPGYRCRCLEGYEGNPYVAGNCTNINECERGNHDCKHDAHCVDTPGNYTCTCKKGYSGDGRKDGNGCSADQSLVIKIVVGITSCVIFLLIFVTCLYLILRKRKLVKLREKFFTQNGGIMLQRRISGNGSSQDQARVFTIEELKRATNNYDEMTIIGKKVLSSDRPEGETNLALHFLNHFSHERLLQVLDEDLQLNDVPSEIIQVSRLAERCLRIKGEERPTMKEVAIELQGISASKIPKHPWVQSRSNENEGEYVPQEQTNNRQCTHGGEVRSSSAFGSLSKDTMSSISSGRYLCDVLMCTAIFVVMFCVICMSALVITSAQEVPACETSCGDVPITFPFGSREGCYYSSDFLVTCDRSSGEPVPFFGRNTTDIEISNMSTSESEVEIMMFVGRDCYDASGPSGGNEPTLRLSDFRISSKNKYVAIGCDMSAYFSRREDESDGTGCITRCDRNSQFTNGSCSGVGCCEVAVPERLQSFNMTLSSFNNHTNITDFNPCSYAFFVEEGKFNFSTTNLLDFRSVNKMPMVLDWAIGNMTCDEAKSMDSFLCNGNSECDQDYGGPGYRCRCLEGYEGNPYVS
ncbi:hypothetical protein QVD17_32119 [Tagetes erecta]|uniref:EGF-like domain-containing protein n=1 Tax=Tagetes erecta TaxID=13708 RepID=A0AAD8K4N7_TARER|nr:hypothetical protein QVD17_32119 [Tagetes erecta]